MGRPRLALTLAGLHRCFICKEVKQLNEFHKDRSTVDGYSFRCKSCNKAYKRNYHAGYHIRAKVEISARRKARYAVNKDKLLAKHRVLHAKNGAQWEATRRAKRRANPIPNMLQMAKHRAKVSGLEFCLTPGDVVIPAVCPVFSVPLVVGASKSNRYSPTIDRIDNSKGYVPGNIVVVSFRANTIKSDATLAELRQVVAFYETIL